jgi:hypothetical protein
MRRYDVAVAYRIYPKLSSPAAALAMAGDKYHVSDLCLRSFKESLGGLRVKMWVLLDGCPPSYRELFLQYFAPEDLVFIDLDHVGNHATFETQINILLTQQDAEVIYFAEDDYFYLPQQFPRLVRFLETNPNVHFVSPYDHPDCFRLELHRHPISMEVFDHKYWSTAGSTCLTFLTKRKTLESTHHVFRTYSCGNHDCSMWLSLTKTVVFNLPKFCRLALGDDHRAQTRLLAKAWLYGWRQILFGQRWNLWIPIPGIATHLDAGAIPSSVDWLSELLQKSEGFRGLASSK